MASVSMLQSRLLSPATCSLNACGRREASSSSIATTMGGFWGTSLRLSAKGPLPRAEPQIRGITITTSQATDVSADVAALQKKFGSGGVKIDLGEGGLPRVVLTHSSGSVVDLYLYGACVTSWKTPVGDDILFVRPDAVFTGAKPISGGIPHCFPQFGPGAMQQHGFARNLSWEVVSSSSSVDEPSVVVRLADSEYTRKMWDFTFEALYTVKLLDGKLWTKLEVKNKDSKPFTFTTALHTYFRAAISGVTVKGLKGCTSLNKDPDPVNPIKGVEERDLVPFPGFVDCMYKKVPSELVLYNGLGGKVTLTSTGWPDAVVWNPYLTMEACYKDFVCVENAQLDEVKVEPGKSWEAEMALIV